LPGCSCLICSMSFVLVLNVCWQTKFDDDDDDTDSDQLINCGSEK